MDSSVEQKDDNLLLACRNENISVIKDFIQSGGNISDVYDVNKKTLIHYCMENGSTSIATLLLDNLPECVDVQDTTGITPLHLATVVNNSKMIQLLIKRHANINMADKEKRTAIHWAVVYGRTEALTILLNANALTNESDIHHVFPLHYAAQTCATPNMEDAGLQIVRNLVKAGGNINCRDSLQRIPLHWTSTVGAIKGTQLILELGSEINAKDATGLTPLHCATSKGYTGIVKMLIKHGADINCADNNGCSPLFYATSMGHISTVKALLEFQADTNHKDKKGRTALHCAATKNKLGIFKILVDAGANPWVPNKAGDTPLHEACFNCNNNIIEAIIETKGASEFINETNVAGQTAMHISAAKNNVTVVQKLIHGGADMNKPLRLENGRVLSPLDISSGLECEVVLKKAGAISLKPHRAEQSESADNEDDNSHANDEAQNTLKMTEISNSRYQNDDPVPVTKQNKAESLVSVNIDPSGEKHNGYMEVENQLNTSGQLIAEAESDSSFDNNSRPKEKVVTENVRTRHTRVVSRDLDTISDQVENPNNSQSIKQVSHQNSKADPQNLKISKDRPKLQELSININKSNKKPSSDEIKHTKLETNSQGARKQVKTSHTSIQTQNKNERNSKVNDKKVIKTTAGPKPSLTPRLMNRSKRDNDRISAEISRQIYIQVHRSVLNYDYIRNTARAIEETGRQRIRATASTSRNGFPKIERSKSNSPFKRPRSTKRRPLTKSRSSSDSSPSVSVSSYSSRVSDTEDRKESRLQSRNRMSRPGTRATTTRTSTAFSNKRAVSSRGVPIDKEKSIRNAYAPFLPPL